MLQINNYDDNNDDDKLNTNSFKSNDAKTDNKLNITTVAIIYNKIDKKSNKYKQFEFRNVVSNTEENEIQINSICNNLFRIRNS